MMWVGIVILVVVLVALYIFVDREIYFYEGTRLGARIQGWLYDKWAAKYDAGKAESQARDHEMLAQPVLDFLKDTPSARVLDLATGTGRLPFALLREPGFTGHIIALDVSLGMLQQSAAKLKAYQGRFELLRHIELPLPFADNSFDVVCCMEALEIMANIEEPLSELHRVLRPGGLLLSSRATEASGRKGKVHTVESFRASVEKAGFESVEIIPWWRVFDRMTARKLGQSQPIGPGGLDAALLCPQCRKTNTYHLKESALECRECQRRIERQEDGIFLN